MRTRRQAVEMRELPPPVEPVEQGAAQDAAQAAPPPPAPLAPKVEAGKVVPRPSVGELTTVPRPEPHPEVLVLRARRELSGIPVTRPPQPRYDEEALIRKLRAEIQSTVVSAVAEAVRAALADREWTPAMPVDVTVPAQVNTQAAMGPTQLSDLVQNVANKPQLGPPTPPHRVGWSLKDAVIGMRWCIRHIRTVMYIVLIAFTYVASGTMGLVDSLTSVASRAVAKSQAPRTPPRTVVDVRCPAPAVCEVTEKDAAPAPNGAGTAATATEAVADPERALLVVPSSLSDMTAQPAITKAVLMLGEIALVGWATPKLLVVTTTLSSLVWAACTSGALSWVAYWFV
jgi:hypothetical protein